MTADFAGSSELQQSPTISLTIRRKWEQKLTFHVPNGYSWAVHSGRCERSWYYDLPSNSFATLIEAWLALPLQRSWYRARPYTLKSWLR